MTNQESLDYACEGCFRDKPLREWIRQEGHVGPCLWCNSTRYHRVPLSSLGPLFRRVACIYQPRDMPGGQVISELLEEDWRIFSNRIAKAPARRMHELAISILRAGLHPKHDVDEPDYGGLFERGEPSVEDEWHVQVADLLAEVPSPLAHIHAALADEEDWVPNRIEATLLEMGETCPAEAMFFRARIYKDLLRTQPFKLTELGAPPPEKAPAQRANRKGESVLYLASNEKTALAEVRAWRGAYVAIATFALVRPMSVLNLTKVSEINSPFFEDELPWRLNSNALLRRFANELSRPIIRGREEDEEFQYRPSQQACGTVRKASYDGVAYPSAMGPGYSFVFFDPCAARPMKSINVRVTSVSHRAAVMPFDAPIYHDWPYDDAPGHRKARTVGAALQS